MCKTGDKYLVALAEKNNHQHMLRAIKKGKMSFKIPQPDVPFLVRDYLSDEDVGVENQDMQHFDSSMMRSSIGKLEKMNQLFVKTTNRSLNR